jgi:copper(I)-binding protein
MNGHQLRLSTLATGLAAWWGASLGAWLWPLLLPAVALGGQPHSMPLQVQVQVKDAWVRWLPGNLPAGGYLTLVNSGGQPASLVKAASPDYADVSIHRSTSVAGTSRMTPVDQIVVAPHSSLEFAAQGYHLMLAHPTRKLAPGDHVTLTLTFADGAVVGAAFDVRAPDAGDGKAQMADMSDMNDMPDMPGMSH